MRHVACLIVVVVAVPVLVRTGRAQSRFEAATIKPSSNCNGGGMPPPGRLSMRCVTLRNAVVSAFSEGATPRRLQVLGGPSWIDTDTYDIEATPINRKVSLLDMYGPMLRQLLEDRFRLQTHKESREQPIYSLAAGKSGVKLTPSPAGSCVPFDADHPLPVPQPGQPLPAICGRIPTQHNGTKVVVRAYGITLGRFARGAFVGFIDRPVVDKTGIEGLFDVHLEFSTDDSDTSLPSVFTAVQEQLGLRLVPDKSPVGVLVIDHIERPSEN